MCDGAKGQGGGCWESSFILGKLGGGSGFPSMLWSIGVFLEWAGLRRGDDCCTELRHTTPSTRVPGWTADTEGGGFVVLYLKPVQFGLSVILA